VYRLAFKLWIEINLPLKSGMAFVCHTTSPKTSLIKNGKTMAQSNFAGLEKKKGAISNLESKLSKSIQELEKHVKALEAKH